MRILIISTFFPPMNSIASLRPYSWAKFWHLEGHSVTVLTTQKNLNSTNSLELLNPGFRVIEIPLPRFVQSLTNTYQGKTQPKKGIKSFFENYAISAFNFLRRKTGVFSACRMPDFTDLWLRPAFKTIQAQGEWDLVISTSGPYVVHLLGNKLKKSGLAKTWITDFRDAWSNNHIYKGLFPFNFLEKYLEGTCLKNADLITTVSESYSQHFEKYKTFKKVAVIENGFDQDDLLDIPKASYFTKDNKFRIVYTGSIYFEKQNVLSLFECIRNLSLDSLNKNLLDNLEVIIAGSSQERLSSLIRDYQIEKWVKNIGFVNRVTALHLQRDASVLLFLPWTDLAVDGVLTGKLFEYLFSKTPVVAIGGSGLEASQKLIIECKAGKCLTTQDEIKKYLLQSLSAIQMEKTMINPVVLERYSRKNLAHKMLSLVPEA